jgi:hypothetical protein
VSTYAHRVPTGEPDADLAALPSEVRATAHVFSNGEVAWPNEHAEAAINALAAAGHKVLGLDARTLFPDGGVMEVPITAGAFRSDEAAGNEVERARRDALKALPFAQSEGTHVLVTW